MNPDYWQEKWKQNDIAFHASEANALLVEHFGSLSLARGARVFLPLCGKTLDIHWMLSKGYRVAGAELSTLAIEQLFSELGVAPVVSNTGELERYSAPNIDIFTGDIFTLHANALGSVDAVYDRAALVAMPPPMRIRYAAHTTQISNNAPQLVICFEYDQTVMEGPPFSVESEVIAGCYAASYDVSLLARTEVPGGLKGQAPAKETAWLLTPKS